MNKQMPRPPLHDNGTPATPQAVGVGQRSIWPYPPVGEAARRDPHIPDPVPGMNRPEGDQRNASPRVAKVGPLYAGGAVNYEGTSMALVYIKRIGSMVTRTLGRNFIAGTIDARWRVGGVSYPRDYGFGPGYHGDSSTVDPEGKANPQIYMRNPGIKPMRSAPATYRYAPNMVQAVGPSIGDLGTTRAPV